MRILLAEDDAALSEQVIAALSEAGFVVDHCGDGVQAEFLGQTEDFDAAILDLGMPGMDGVSALHRWREAGRNFPVLVPPPAPAGTTSWRVSTPARTTPTKPAELAEPCSGYGP